MNTSEPFCIRGKHPKPFWHGYEDRGYLPAIEPTPGTVEPAGKEVIYTDDSYQLRARVMYLQKKLIEHLNTHSDKKKKGDII